MKIKTRVVKFGNGYAMSVPKALVDCELLIPGQEYYIEPVKKAISEPATADSGEHECGNWGFAPQNIITSLKSLISNQFIVPNYQGVEA